MCTCREPQPRRHHWAWQCKDTGCTGVDPPTTESEKRLCVPMVERPAHDSRRDYRPITGLRQATMNAVDRRGWALIATDGGSKGTCFDDRWASFGIALEGRHWSGKIGGLDQTSYTSELWALYKLVVTIKGIQGRIIVIIDNQAVAREVALRKGAMSSPQVLFALLGTPLP